MKIIKNWFYKLSWIKDNLIIIENNLNVILFDEWNLKRQIEIMNNSKVEIYWFLKSINKYTFEVKINWKNSNLKIGYLLLSWNKEELNIKIHSSLWANYSKINKKIISIVWKNWIINLDWTLKINKWLKEVSWHLNEENLFLSKNWKINCIPSLLVASNRIKASHSCKIEKISDEQLFYLRSRWIKKDNALNMIVTSYIKILFQCMWMIDKNFYNKVINDVLETIKEKT